MMTEPIHMGFVGAGSMGQCAHLKHYASIPGCRVTALAELRPRFAEAVEALEDLKIARDYVNLWKEPSA